MFICSLKICKKILTYVRPPRPLPLATPWFWNQACPSCTLSTWCHQWWGWWLPPMRSTGLQKNPAVGRSPSPGHYHLQIGSRIRRGEAESARRGWFCTEGLMSSHFAATHCQLETHCTPPLNENFAEKFPFWCDVAPSLHMMFRSKSSKLTSPRENCGKLTLLTSAPLWTLFRSWISPLLLVSHPKIVFFCKGASGKFLESLYFCLFSCEYLKTSESENWALFGQIFCQRGGWRGWLWTRRISQVEAFTFTQTPFIPSSHVTHWISITTTFGIAIIIKTDLQVIYIEISSINDCD